MPYRGEAIGRSRDKDKKMFRESSKERYEIEKKETEKECHDNKIEIEKLLNEGFEYYDTKVEHGINYAVFKEKGKDNFRELKFEYEENYSHLKDMWIVKVEE